MFPYEAQFKKVRDLSGGERARLALLNLTLGRYNLLVLDEPTNHLDVEMITALEDALQAYEGTLLFVSHDRRFLEALAQEVWEVDGGRFEQYEGDWGFYQRRKESAQRTPGAGQNGRYSGVASATPAAASHREEASSRSGPSKWQMERRLEALEA